MQIRVWQFNNDDSFVPSFLEGMSMAHEEPVRSEEWFRWKFEQSPYGKAIMACAFDGETVAGCVAYGRGVMQYENKEWNCALSYETFVRPDYQGHGLFKKLIALAEQEMANEGVQFVYNFPNTNSITGFKHMGWICRNDVRCFKIRVQHLCKTALHVLDLKKPFEPNVSNWDNIKRFAPVDLPIENTNAKVITPVWSADYIRWRFFSIPNREYYVLNTDTVFSISMIGKRGHLKTAHVLYSISKKDKTMGSSIRETLKSLKKNVSPDVIEYASSVFDSTLEGVMGFFKVPASGNFCYKILDESLKIDDFKMVLPSINAHTY
ncbi:MAG: GNAT family N-acetyltransferase [Prevotella sp.]|nr:GNAT family N-acetyltransferase [Prevotella sp.]